MTLYLALKGYDTHIWAHTHVAAQTQNTNSIPFTSNLLCRFELSSLSVRYGCNAVKILIRLHKLAVVQHANSLLTVESALDGALEKKHSSVSAANAAAMRGSKSTHGAC